MNIVWGTASTGGYGGTVYPGGIRYSLVNNVCGVQYSLGYRIHEFRTASDERAGPGNEATLVLHARVAYIIHVYITHRSLYIASYLFHNAQVGVSKKPPQGNALSGPFEGRVYIDAP